MWLGYFLGLVSQFWRFIKIKMNYNSAKLVEKQISYYHLRKQRLLKKYIFFFKADFLDMHKRQTIAVKAKNVVRLKLKMMEKNGKRFFVKQSQATSKEYGFFLKNSLNKINTIALPYPINPQKSTTDDKLSITQIKISRKNIIGLRYCRVFC